MTDLGLMGIVTVIGSPGAKAPTLIEAPPVKLELLHTYIYYIWNCLKN